MRRAALPQRPVQVPGACSAGGLPCVAATRAFPVTALRRVWSVALGAFFAVACSAPEHELRRPLEGGGAVELEYGQEGDTTRPFLRIDPGRGDFSEFDLGAVGRAF